MTSDAQLAARVAGEVGGLLLHLRAEPPTGGPDALRAAADRAADDLAHDLLRATVPDDVVLSEESPDPGRRLAADRVWIVDPLDGTREFGEPGRDDWAVHVALWGRSSSVPAGSSSGGPVSGGPVSGGLVSGGLVAGAVALPARGLVLATDPAPVVPAPGRGAGPAGGPVLVVSRSREPAVAARVAAELGLRTARMGSVGAKVGALLTGAADLYLETGGLHEWDAAAPAAAAAAAGLAVAGTDGSPVLFNQPDPRRTGLLVGRPELVRAAVRVLTDR